MLLRIILTAGLAVVLILSILVLAIFHFIAMSIGCNKKINRFAYKVNGF